MECILSNNYLNILQKYIWWISIYHRVIFLHEVKDTERNCLVYIFLAYGCTNKSLERGIKCSEFVTSFYRFAFPWLH